MGRASLNSSTDVLVEIQPSGPCPMRKQYENTSPVSPLYHWRAQPQTAFSLP
jgi:hypothetical protein